MEVVVVDPYLFEKMNLVNFHHSENWVVEVEVEVAVKEEEELKEVE